MTASHGSKSLKRARMHGILAIALVASLGQPVQADQNLNCDAYAASAVAQYHEAKKLGCSFTGNRWSGNTSLHRSWCLGPGVKINHLGIEQNARQQALAKCASANQKVDQTKKAAKRSKCRYYAETAVKLGRENVSFGCGYQDGRFDINYDGHFNWCMGVAYADAKRELARSGGAIGACKRKNAAFRFENPQPPWCKDGTCRLDVCWESAGKICNGAAALNFCGYKGFRKVVTFKTAKAIITNHGDGGSCSGNCSYFTRIVCKDKS